MEKTIIVTGSNGGIGQAICAQLKSLGLRVVGLDIASAGNLVDCYCQTDLASHTRLLESLEQIEAEFADSLYGLVNNAGLYEALDFHTLTVADYERIMAVNIRAPLFISQWFSRVLRARQHQGVIVNIGSISGESGSQDVVYGVSKGAVMNLTRSLALALAPDIRVNTVSPGIIATSMAEKIPQDRIKDYESRILNRHFGTPDDVAQAVAFLLREESRYINNALLNVHGGLH
ncbi:MAG TPA: SDR family oxidoreductase [Cellvibrio sp.]|nr:SDR family oxidoreductase [Cellvibrio sp.]